METTAAATVLVVLAADGNWTVCVYDCCMARNSLKRVTLTLLLVRTPRLATSGLLVIICGPVPRPRVGLLTDIPDPDPDPERRCRILLSSALAALAGDQLRD